MEEFIAELEAQRIAELEAYLSAAGLKNFELTLKKSKYWRNSCNDGVWVIQSSRCVSG